MGRNEQLHKGVDPGPDGTVQLMIPHFVGEAIALAHNASVAVHGNSGNAGSTTNVWTAKPWTGGGYGVGGQGVKETVRGVDVPLDPDDATKHVEVVRDAVGGRDAYAGTWRAPDGRNVLDASAVFHDRRRAREEQITRGEEAVFNFDTKEAEDLRKDHK